MLKKLQSLFFLTFLFISHLMAASPAANAEDIPILIWERGQTQNVVMGVGATDEHWDLYLVGDNRAKFPLSRSIKNKEGFFVYSIDLNPKFVLGGYVVEAISANGETKQVAGIQVIQPVVKDITRVPFELLLVLFGFSFMVFTFNHSRMQINKFPNFDDIQPEIAHKENIVTRKFRFWVEQHANNSLIRHLLLDDLKFESKFSRQTSILGVMGTLLLIGMQLQTGNWLAGLPMLMIASLILGNISVTFGILSFALSILFSLLNISIAKSLSEVLSILVISSLYILPNLYNQYLLKLLVSTFQTVSKGASRILMLLPAAISAVSAYQICLLYESLRLAANENVLSKELIALGLFLVFIVKNFQYHKLMNFEEKFEITRTLSPTSTLIVSIFTGLVGYIWTTNIIISLVTLVSCFSILSLNWIKFNLNFKLNLPEISYLYGVVLLIVIYFSLNIFVKYLPLDVVNRSNLMVLLIFPIDLLLAIYMALSFTLKNRAVVS